MSLQAIINHTDEIQKEINLSGYQSEYFCNRMLVEKHSSFSKVAVCYVCVVLSVIFIKNIEHFKLFNLFT